MTYDRADVVVGVDGSPSGEQALYWAADEAYRRDIRLRVIACYAWPWPVERFGGLADLRAAQRDRFTAMVGAYVDEVRRRYPDLAVYGTAVPGEPTTELLAAADGAALLVVGNRGHGGFGGLLLGSVSQRLATHARTPVVVVRGRRGGSHGPVVVGADGSAAADRALTLGFAEAGHRGGRLVAVRAYTTHLPSWGPDVTGLPYDPRNLVDADHEAFVASMARWRRTYPDVTVDTRFEPGSAGKVLTWLSHDAALLVVGDSGHGSLAGILLGSVCLQVLHHANCPVLIARPTAPG